jgi:hypothetical protein
MENSDSNKDGIVTFKEYLKNVFGIYWPDDVEGYYINFLDQIELVSWEKMDLIKQNFWNFDLNHDFLID